MIKLIPFFSLRQVGVLCAVLALCLSAQAQSLRTSPTLSGVRISGAGSVQRSADYIVAVVNSEPITNNEVRARVLRFEQQQTQRGGVLPTRQELSQQMLERLISERAQMQSGRENGIKIDDAALNTSVQNIARQNQISVDELRKRLEADGISYTLFRDNLRDEMLLGRVRERESEARINITEQELDDFVQEQKGSVQTSLELNLAQILIAVPESATPTQLQEFEARAAVAAQRARAGEDFAVLARSLSQAFDRANGGVMGLRSAERYPELFVEATKSLLVGGIAGPLRSSAGFHVLKLLEKKQSSGPSMTVVQSRARHILLRISPQRTESVALARLAELRADIAGGKLDFAVAARENSQDGSAKDGGDLGWANPGQYVPEFEEVMNTLAVGQISAPLVSRFGVHLIQLQERRENALSAREQRELARGTLREKKAEEAFTAWVEDVRAKAYIERREPPQ